MVKAARQFKLNVVNCEAATSQISLIIPSPFGGGGRGGWTRRIQFVCHAGPDPASRGPRKYWIPAFAGMTTFLGTLSLWTDTNYRLLSNRIT